MLITTYKVVNQLQHSCISLPTATVSVDTYITRVVWQTKCELMMCISRVLRVTCARQNRMQKCVHTPVFKVLHALNMQTHTCACTRV